MELWTWRIRILLKKNIIKLQKKPQNTKVNRFETYFEFFKDLISTNSNLISYLFENKLFELLIRSTFEFD